MSLTHERIEGLAPDQASLAAARKLLKTPSWPTLAQGDGLIWGECQGSGATPYRVVVSEDDVGYKCTCPSRKFPCKHTLALMWMRVDRSTSFVSATVPDWVKDWLSRRRGSSTPGNQVQRGVANFVAQAARACRTIAQRLVDAKASGLAGRLDALPSRLFTLPGPARPSAALRELGQVHLISQAYRRASQLPELLAADARQAVGWSVTRDALLNDSEALRAAAKWRVFAVLSEAQPDRLRRVETWLCRENDGNPACAVLIDFVPNSTGAAAGGYLVGDEIDAELTFYRSSVPLRAQITKLNRGAEQSRRPFTSPMEGLGTSYANYEQALARLPWLGTMPLTFRSASVRRHGEQLYLHDEQSELSLPLDPSLATHALPLAALDRIDGIGLWNGYEFTMAWAETRIGRWLRS